MSKTNKNKKTGGKAVCYSCKNNGTCPYCTSNRTIKNKKRLLKFALEKTSNIREHPEEGNP